MILFIIKKTGSDKQKRRQNKQNLVKHRGYYVCVHSCSLPLASKGKDSNLVAKEENVEKTEPNKRKLQ